MPIAIFTKQDWDAQAKALKGVPAGKPVAINAGHLRSILKAINRDALPDEEPDDDLASDEL